MKTSTFMLIALGFAMPAASMAMSSSDKDLAFNSFNNAFFHVDGSGNGYYYTDTNRTIPSRTDFWRVCEEIEVAEDAYERTGNSVYKGMITQLINGLNNVVSGTTNWTSWNTFNDDILWGCIALVRAYQDTGNVNFLTQSEIQFNNVWSRGWDSALGGGLWQTTGKVSKNTCVNGPAAIAGIYLARNTTGTGFRGQANQAWNWMLTHLYNSGTGEVADHVNTDGSVTWWAFTYNQGVFIGAATLQYMDNGNTSNLSYAQLAGNWAKNNLAGQHVAGILNDEYDSNGGNGDPVGFKGIFARWCGLYASKNNDTTIKSWLTTNANTAWANRNPNGLTWAQWWHVDTSSYLTAWECSSAVAIEQDAP